MAEAPTETTIKLSSLVQNDSIYPRDEVDSNHVKRLLDAYESGERFGPLLVARPSLTLLDGYHRFNVYQRTLDADAEVEVAFVDTDNEAEMLRLAAEANSRHGKPFEVQERRHLVLRLKDLGYSPSIIAKSMAMTEGTVTRFTSQVVFTGGGVQKLTPLPIKPAVRHLEGQTLTERQASGYRSLPGAGWPTTVTQLLIGLKSDTLPRNEDTIRRLTELADAIATWMAEVPETV